MPWPTSWTSTVSSSVIRTANRSTWSGRRLTGCTWIARHEHRARRAAGDLEVDEGRRAGVPAEELELVGVEGDGLGLGAVAEDDAGQARPPCEDGQRPCRSRCGARPRARDGSAMECDSSLVWRALRPRGWGRRLDTRRATASASRVSSGRLPHAPVTHPIRRRRRPGRVGSRRRGRHHPHRRRRVRRRARHPVRPPAGGVRGRGRALGRGGPGVRHDPGART